MGGAWLFGVEAVEGRSSAEYHAKKYPEHPFSPRERDHLELSRPYLEVGYLTFDWSLMRLLVRGRLAW